VASRQGIDRLVTFVDAVVAIAATLLVLPLADLAVNQGAGQSTADLLRHNSNPLLAFVVSFLVIVRFWFAHHRLYDRIADYNTALLWANMVWLLSIVFLPFPTELIAAKGTKDALTAALYLGTMFLSSCALFAMDWLVQRNSELQAPDTRAPGLMPGAIKAALLGLVLIIGVTVRPVGLYALFLLLLEGPLIRLLHKRDRL
jgi:uncharacterized membrane protein